MTQFIIKGKPKALKRHRVGKFGRMYDPSYKDKKDLWLQIARFKPKQALKGEIMIKLIFVMPRPKSHYRTGKYSHILKENMPEYHSFTPDLDNLVKFLLDTIAGKDRFIVDDSQICRIQAEKIYGKPRTEVIIEEIS